MIINGRTTKVWLINKDGDRVALDQLIQMQSGQTYYLPDLVYTSPHTTTNADLPAQPKPLTFEMVMELGEEGLKLFEELRTIYYVASSFIPKGKQYQLPNCDYWLIHPDDVEECTQIAKEQGLRLASMTGERWALEIEKAIRKAADKLRGAI